MQTEAVFDNIAERIQEEIGRAKNSIYIAVAWFTNKQIFDALVSKAEEGCQVSLMFTNDHINQRSSIDFDRLNIESSRVYSIGDGDRELMHNKFCVIDHCIVITGSYNWSYKAETNFENIVVTDYDTALAEQFIKEFTKIRDTYHPENGEEKKDFPISQIIKRLEILKNYVLLEEIDELKRGTSKLKAFDFNTDIDRIITLIHAEDFGEAIKKIESFISKNLQLAVWTDPEIAALKLQIKNLENQVNAFDNERTELEKTLSDFQHRHMMELGELILGLLKVRKQLFEEDQDKYEEYKEAEKEEKEYKGQLEEEREKEIFELDDDQKAELKKKFRKSTTLCHPDKFQNEPPEVQQQAEQIFKELNEANSKNDLKTVAKILENLEKGILTSLKGEGLSDKGLLRATIERLKIKLEELAGQIQNIKQNETFELLSEIDDWDLYFEQTREKLQEELDELRKKL